MPEILLDTLAESPIAKPTPIQRVCQEILLVSFGEKTDEDIAQTIAQAVSEINEENAVENAFCLKRCSLNTIHSPIIIARTWHCFVVAIGQRSF